ncbi:hypothetical protein AB0M36_35995, partial [Actinoplanes sp. NPDC051346]|uniref:hypothetical protein n=1 Tax=Actinoplanes sp. NPDC051346 TaxID=3155048 RepID=UPI003441E09E
MMKKANSASSKEVRNGLIGGAIVLVLCCGGVASFLILQPGMLTLAELGSDLVWERGQPPSIMDGCVD